MTLRKANAKILILLTLSGFPSISFAQDDFFLVSSVKFDCLQKNAPSYFETEGSDFIFIRPEDCGTDAGVPLKLAELAENASPDLVMPEISNDDALKPDAVIALMREDLDCIANLKIPEGSELLAYYPERCHVETRP